MLVSEYPEVDKAMIAYWEATNGISCARYSAEKMFGRWEVNLQDRERMFRG